MPPLVAGIIGCSMLTILLAGAALAAINIPRVVTAVPVDDRVRAIRRFMAVAGFFLLTTIVLSLALIARYVASVL